MTTDKNLYGPTKVGGDVLAYCTKCKMELAHVIVSVVDGRPSKVLCKTCRTQRNFRKTAGAPSAKSSPATRLGMGPKARVPVTAIRTAELWEKKLAEAKVDSAQPYSPKTVYAKGDVIEHPKFGKGLVEEMKGRGKVSVFFRDGDKILVHGVGTETANAS